MADPCRCGWPGEGSHRCHSQRHYGDAARCPRDGSPRQYLISQPLGTHALAGMQLKLAATSYHTIACDECWRAYIEALEAPHDR